MKKLFIIKAMHVILIGFILGTFTAPSSTAAVPPEARLQELKTAARTYAGANPAKKNEYTTASHEAELDLESRGKLTIASYSLKVGEVALGTVLAAITAASDDKVSSGVIIGFGAATAVVALAEGVITYIRDYRQGFVAKVEPLLVQCLNECTGDGGAIELGANERLYMKRYLKEELLRDDPS